MEWANWQALIAFWTIGIETTTVAQYSTIYTSTIHKLVKDFNDKEV